MGMTIDDAIKHMKQARYDYCEYWEETRNDTTIAFDIAIDTMRKYQKIKNIICKWEDGLYDDEGISHVEILDMISNEVNGDGND